MKIWKKAGAVCCGVFLLIGSGCQGQEILPPAQQPDKQELSLIEDMSADFLAAENEQLRMTLSFSPLNILIEDKASGKVWSTNPTDVDQDMTAVEDLKAFLKSQLTFSYIDNRSLTTVDSFTECDETEQYQIYQLPDGVRIEYTFGETGISDTDIPMQLTPVRAEKLFLKNSALTAEEIACFESCYTYDEEAGGWLYNEYNFGEKVDNLLLLFEKLGYSGEDLRQDAADFGETIEVPEKLGFMIPVEYRLDGGDFITHVPTGEIVYPQGNPILELTVNGYFGAAQNDSDGYILAPDGCGALMRFGDTVRSEVDLPLYGRDSITSDSGTTVKLQPALLPVYGLKSGEHAFFGIIEEGDAVTSLSITPAMYNSSYNSVVTSFMLHTRDKMALGMQDSVNEVELVQAQGYTGDITLRYHFLSGEAADYQGMAAYYRGYLMETAGYQLKAAPEKMPFFLETVGSVKGRKSFLGINYQGDKVLTSFTQTGELIDTLKEAGISNPITKVSGWMNGGYIQEAIKDLKIVGAIGGRKGLTELYAGHSAVFPSIQMLTAPSSRGLSLTKEVARKIDEQYARTYRFDMQEEEDWLADGYILSPAVYNSLMEGFLRKYQKLGISTLSIDDIGNGVYGDYGKERSVDRQEAIAAVDTVLQSLSDYQLMLTQANVHTAKYADYVLEAPMDSNHYFSLEDNIPFYQMVMRGFFQYTGTPLNLSSQNEEDYLRYLQYGAMPYYKVIGRSADQIEISEVDDLYSVEFDGWSKQMIMQYQQAAAALEPVKDAVMVDCCQVAEDVYVTAFDNGKRLFVNYGTAAWEVWGQQVPAKGFLLTDQ